MYRNYFKKTLDTNSLRIKNKDAPKGQRFCNGACFSYVDSTEFSGTNPKNIKMICSKCRRLIARTKRHIKQEKFTLEQFRENPNISDGCTSVVTQKQSCSECKKDKLISEFSAGKKQCKPCKAAKIRAKNTDIKEEINEIENTKLLFSNLKLVLEHISKGKLCNVIKHYKVGRKSTDTKPIMVENIVNFFRKTQNPFFCAGGCGFTLKQPNSICESCGKKSIRKKASGKLSPKEFDDTLDEICKNLQEIDHHDSKTRYNTSQLYKIGKRLGLPIKQSMVRPKRVLMINKYLTDKDDNVEVVVEKKVEQTALELNGIFIESRGDGFINATQLCKAGGKLFGHWYSLNSTKELIYELVEDLKCETTIPIIKNKDGIIQNTIIEIPIIKNKDGIIQNTNVNNPIIKNKDDIIQNTNVSLTTLENINVVDVKVGRGKQSGSWIHPDLAGQLAQWVSKKFAIRVSRWIRELATTGSVTLGSEKTSQELLRLQLELASTKNKYKKLVITHTKSLKKRSRYKFNKGPVFYIVSYTKNTKKIYKVGHESVNVNARLANYRTLHPDVWIECIVYTNDNVMLEKSVLTRFRKERQPFGNHELIFDMNLMYLLSFVKTIVSILNIEHSFETNINKYNEMIKDISNK